MSRGPDAPLTRDRIVSAAEDVLRRFGPAKATVVDVARALGVSHAAVYRHVATKAELRDLVVGRWAESTMAPLRAVAAHLNELVALGATIIRSGVEKGTFRTVDPVAASRALLFATSRFHHPMHAAEWADPAIDVVYDDVWRMLMDGLRVAKSAGRSSKQRRRQIP
jgi:AcrR family transcriptional regulator